MGWLVLLVHYAPSTLNPRLIMVHVLREQMNFAFSVSCAGGVLLVSESKSVKLTT